MHEYTYIVDIPFFRTLFPIFADEEKFPDSLINYYNMLARVELKPTNLTGLYLRAVYLYIAHFLSKTATDYSDTESMGKDNGTESSHNKQVGQVSESVSYDTTNNNPSTAEDELNSTVFGKELLQLLIRRGKGGILSYGK